MQRKPAAIQQLITAVQQRWGARALRFLGDAATAPAVAAVPTGFTALDNALGIGGMPRGRITELLGTPTSGMTTIALTLIAQTQAHGDVTGYIDLSRTSTGMVRICGKGGISNSIDEPRRLS